MSIQVQYLDHMGTDLSVVNAARTSFSKESEALTHADIKLIRFLATGYRTNDWQALLDKITEHAGFREHDNLTALLQAHARRPQHWAPFAHPHVSIRMTVPMFLARQLVKHQVGGVWSEESRRYITDEPQFWFPDEWHTRPEDIKQGAGAVIQHSMVAADVAHRATVSALFSYDELLKMGVAPEEARIVLPLNTLTTVVWTGSLLFWSRVYNQRSDGHAQLAAQEFAQKLGAVVAPLFPVSWPALTGGTK